MVLGASRECGGGRLLCLLAEEGDQIVPVLALLQATKCHLGAGDVLLRVLKVLELYSCQRSSP